MLKSWRSFVLQCGKIITLPGGRYTDTKNLTVLLTFATHRKSRKILELMTAYGDTSVALARAIPDAEIFTFDVSIEDGGPGTDIGNCDHILPRNQVGSAIDTAEPDVKKRIYRVVDNGAKLAKHVEAAGPYDFAYIDGNHTWRYIINDTKLALKTVRDGGILTWDDYQPCQVEVRAVIDMLNERIGGRIALVDGTRICYLDIDAVMREKLEQAIADL